MEGRQLLIGLAYRASSPIRMFLLLQCKDVNT